MDSGPRPVIVVHSLAHARAALAAAGEAGVAVTLASAAAAAGYAGPGWFKALTDLAMAEHPGVAADALLDCGDEAGSVLGALRRGLRRLRYAGPPATAARLAAIAVQYGARLEAPGGAADDAPRLDLLDARDPEAACRAFLAGLARRS